MGYEVSDPAPPTSGQQTSGKTVNMVNEVNTVGFQENRAPGQPRMHAEGLHRTNRTDKTNRNTRRPSSWTPEPPTSNLPPPTSHLPMPSPRLTDSAQAWIAETLRPGDAAVDATAGRG